jgi:thiol-disulfide isomerase/thioredoxin
MKKKFLIVVVVLVGLLFVAYKAINVKISTTESTLEVHQKTTIANSSFGKTYLNNDKIICINIWATWCVPCVQEIPILNKIKEKHPSKKIEYLSMSIDADTIRLKKFIQSNRFKFKDITFENLDYKNAILNYLENKPLEERIYTIPKTYLIKNNKVIFKVDGEVNEKELVEVIHKALKQ